MSPDLPLVLWIIATIASYRFLDGRAATLAAMLVGWAVLPNQAYPAATHAGAAELTGPIHALAIPSPPLLDKGSAIGLGCLIGAILFDWPRLRRSGRPRWYDVPIILFCLAPITSTLANGLPVREGLDQSRHLALAWGVPYALGRAQFASGPALLPFARAWAIGGLATLIPGLVEFARGPFLYRLAYGFHPYRFSGAERTIGHRPVLFFENGNQFGMWAATAAVASAWVAATGGRDAWRLGRWRIPASVPPVVLVGSCLLWQSHSAIVLMLAGLAPLAFRGRLGPAGRRLVLGGLVLVGLAAIGAGVWIVAHSGGDLRGAGRALFHGIGKSSFTWRLARVADQIPRLEGRPLLGWGRADWSGTTPDGTFQDPVALSLGFLALGMYGIVGLVLLLGVLLTPLVGALAKLRRLEWDRVPWAGAAASAALLSVNVADLSMNSTLLLPVLLAAGGLNAWSFGPVGGTDARPIERGSQSYSLDALRGG